MKDEFKEDGAYMSGIKKVEELVCDQKFIGLYDIEERRQRDILDFELTGLRKGKEERSVEIAKSMLDDKVSIENISKYTGLSIEEINTLQI